MSTDGMAFLYLTLVGLASILGPIVDKAIAARHGDDGMKRVTTTASARRNKQITKIKEVRR